MIGNGRSTVLRALFRKRELTEFCGNLGEFCKKNSVSSLICTQVIGREELTELSPQNSARAKNPLSSAFETALSETVFGPSPRKGQKRTTKKGRVQIGKTPPSCRRVKQAQCGKLAFSQGNRAHFAHFEGIWFFFFLPQPLGSPVCAINSNRKPLFAGIKTSRRNVPFYIRTHQKSLLIFVVPKRRK